MSERSLLITALALGASGVASAAVVGPVYPPPGGVTWSGTGNAGRAGGATWSYSNFSPSELPTLYWGKNSNSNIELALDGSVDSAGETLSLTSVSGNIATWSGSSTLWISNGYGYSAMSLSTRFIPAVSNGSFVPPGTVDPAFPTAASAVINVPGNYSANFAFQVFYGGSWAGALDVFDSLQTQPGQAVRTNFAAGFYSVPEPSLPLLGGAIAMLTAARRRRKA